VLLLFAVMLTRAPIGPSTDLDRPAGPAALIGAGTGFGLAALLADAFHWTRYDLPPTGTAERVGEQIFGGWVLPFEVLSILLLAALVGAIVLSRPDLGARPDPEAAQVPATVPPCDPTAESAAVIARLERIAARQADAQARLRQTAAEQRAAAAESDDPEPSSPTLTIQDTLKGKAADVIFGAQARRTPLGTDTPPEPGTTPDDIIEGTATETAPPRPSRDRPATRPAIEGTETGATGRPAIEGTETGPTGRAAPGRPSGRRAIEGSATEPAGGDDQPALGEGRRPRRGVSGPAGRPALPTSDEDTKPEGDA
jgi:NADH-ubiquinone/plastoquinone oxidoreductase subunit 6